MHKSVRLLFLGLFILGLLVINCHKATLNALRVVSVNKGNVVSVDIVDNWTYTDPEDGSVVFEQSTPDVAVPIELAYTELGTGLPTYPGPYTAKITKYTVTFFDVSPGVEEAPFGDAVKGACNFLITADPDMKNTVSQQINIMPADWIFTWMGDLMEEVPPVEKILKATVRLEGLDEISGKAVSDSGYVTINAADYIDDITKKGS